MSSINKKQFKCITLKKFKKEFWKFKRHIVGAVARFFVIFGEIYTLEF